MERVSKYLPVGSMWIDARPRSQYVCGLTLGGETENPQYGGEAAQRCVSIASEACRSTCEPADLRTSMTATTAWISRTQPFDGPADKRRTMVSTTNTIASRAGCW